MTREKQPNIFAHIKIMRKEIEYELFHNNISYKLATFILNEIDEVLKYIAAGGTIFESCDKCNHEQYRCLECTLRMMRGEK